MADSKTFPVRVDVRFKCPFCGADAGASSDRGAVIHAVPLCPEFEEKDPISYMAAVNVETVRKRMS